jgi:FkbM family methyltransferase
MIKRMISRILCNEATGRLILLLYRHKVPNLRYPHFRFDLTDAKMDKKLIASIFWGIYESAEIRFVEKYFKGEVDAIEFGASCGVVSSHIVSKLKGSQRRLIGVEANHSLSKTWKSNVSVHNLNKAGILFLNRAVSYNGDSVKFALSSNTTESKIASSDVGENGYVEVSSITLAGLMEEFQVHNDYALFCDIEGAELQVFLNEDAALKKCKYLFIELHASNEKNSYYSVEDLNRLIQKRGFKLIDKHGPVFHYRQS